MLKPFKQPLLAIIALFHVFLHGRVVSGALNFANQIVEP